MPALRYRLVNVFTREGEALSGNPLCVFEDGSGLDAPTMQALARQFNLSETTFLLPSAQAHARVRIFTPSGEIAFAGHPTLGTAHVCRALKLAGDTLALEMKAGVIRVEAHGRRFTLEAPSAAHRDVTLPRTALAAALGLETSDIAERPLWVKSGREQLIVPLSSVEAVRRAAPTTKEFAAIQSEDGISMAYVFAHRGADGAFARYFFARGGAVLEDPATGSAAANLGGWWLALRPGRAARVAIAQGELIARPSTLFLEMTEANGIRVGGDVIEIGAGQVAL
jgi:trans-2,3-dihydro-3-hydroxyanthranilate isomerase